MKSPTLLLVLSLALPCTAEEESEFRPSPLAQQETFPEKSWEPDDKASWQGPFAEVLTDFLKAGLPDPAGLPYHRVTIVTGNCYTGDNGPTETEGWLLPGEEKSERFAIAWNGLVYPVLEDRGAIELKATVEKILKTGEKERAPWYSNGDEATGVTPTSVTLIHGLYLTRLGFPEAAEHIQKGREEALKTPPLKEELAIDWTWSHFDRAVCAHMRGDSKMVLASVAGLKRAMTGLEPTMKAVDPMFGNGAGWIESAGQLAKEAERRLKAGKVGSLDEKAFLATKPGTAQLIDALDRIQMPQDGQPGDVPLWESPLVLALVEKGDQAVEPLLACLEGDLRLTQSVHFWRSHHKSRTILGVHEAALYALQSLLQGNFFELASTGDSLTGRGDEYRKKLAAGIRANWEKYGRRTGPQRAYQVLSDDEAGIEGWLDAAGALFYAVIYDDETGEPIPQKGPMPGEVLRERKDPSVSDLLEKRLAGVGKAADEGDDDAKHARMAFLAILLDWDAVRGRTKIAEQAGRWLNNGVWSSEDTGTLVSFLKEVSAKAPEILPLCEQVAWTLTPDKYDGWMHRAGFVTQLVLKHGASLKRPAADLWTQPDSPWCLKQLDLRDLSDVISCWADQDLPGKAPFREWVEQLLADDTTLGEAMIEPDDHGRWSYRWEGESSGSWPVSASKKFALTPDKPLPIRRKDVTSKEIVDSRSTGDDSEDPELEYYWSLADRDEWLDKVRSDLTKASPTEKSK